MSESEILTREEFVDSVYILFNRPGGIDECAKLIDAITAHDAALRAANERLTLAAAHPHACVPKEQYVELQGENARLTAALREIADHEKALGREHSFAERIAREALEVKNG